MGEKIHRETVRRNARSKRNGRGPKGVAKEAGKMWDLRMREVARAYSPMGDPNGGPRGGMPIGGGPG